MADTAVSTPDAAAPEFSGSRPPRTGASVTSGTIGKKAATVLRREARWLATHRSVRTLSQFQARRGLPLARLMVDPVARANPYPCHEQIREYGRLVKTPLMSVTVDHAVVSGILRDPRFGVAIGDAGGLPSVVSWAFRSPDPNLASVVDAPSLLAVDPPEHTRYRRLVSKPFTPKALKSVAERVEARATELLDGLEGRDVVDIVEEYASQLPVAVISEILAVPDDMQQQFLAWGNALVPVLDIGLSHREYMNVLRGERVLNDWFDGHFDRLRREPGEDILSQLVNADPADRLNDVELRATAILLLGAGFETTVNLLGSGVAVLVGDEKSRARLASDPALWPQAVEELLRYESPVQLTGRVCREDAEVDGVEISRGTAIICLLGGANRDPGVFADPATYDLDRPNSKEHVAFSGGVHYCLGSNLARMEGEIGLRLLFERFPDVRVLGGVRRDLQTLRGYESLVVALHG
ncbi:MAG: cytochrome P450 [Mycobacteriales bacterium]